MEGAQIPGPDLGTPSLILRNVLLCFSPSTPLIGSKPRPGRPSSASEPYTGSDSTVGCVIFSRLGFRCWDVAVGEALVSLQESQATIRKYQLYMLESGPG